MRRFKNYFLNISYLFLHLVSPAAEIQFHQVWRYEGAETGAINGIHFVFFFIYALLSINFDRYNLNRWNTETLISSEKELHLVLCNTDGLEMNLSQNFQWLIFHRSTNFELLIRLQSNTWNIKQVEQWAKVEVKPFDTIVAVKKGSNSYT